METNNSREFSQQRQYNRPPRQRGTRYYRKSYSSHTQSRREEESEREQQVDAKPAEHLPQDVSTAALLATIKEQEKRNPYHSRNPRNQNHSSDHQEQYVHYESKPRTYNWKKENFSQRRQSNDGISFTGHSIEGKTRGHASTYRGNSSHKRHYGGKDMFRHNVREPVKTKADSATQRERLTEQLTNGTYECMVCCEKVKQDHAVWSCGQCFHIFHLRCIKKWITSSKDEQDQWRCPGCQFTRVTSVKEYYCFCNKKKNPEWNRRDTPHSCGDVCAKRLGDGVSCNHSCTLLCHPGPCPPCTAQVMRTCPCGKTSQMSKCLLLNNLTCSNPCQKGLECGLHACTLSCHLGPCPSCSVLIKQECYCKTSHRDVPCSAENVNTLNFECGKICGRLLSCGNHTCDKNCHQGPCGRCPRSLEEIQSCACGKTTLNDLYKLQLVNERKSCTDPIPVCGKPCQRILPCGPPESRHTCPLLCHEGPCPQCKSTTIVKCRCGRTEKKILCKELNAGVMNILCERRCNKKRHCGRHKCLEVCCIDKEHICPLICGRLLSCGLHRCEALCHTGNCGRCHMVSFEELRCRCGAQVVYPPVHCGIRPPECDKPCIVPRPCEHPPSHPCHSGNICPPCTILCEKWCYGKHELRKNVPCHLTEVSCGKPCSKLLPCQRHKCILTCHSGECPRNCTQPCRMVREECGHPCNAPCHDGECPKSPCRQTVKIQCQCGQRTATVSCEEQRCAFRKMATSILASKMAALQAGECIDLKDLLGNNTATKKDKSLECNEECALVERNRRLALALQIKNPDPKPGAPRYGELLKEWARKDAKFVQQVHDKLTEVVHLAKQSVGKQKSRSYSFPCMNREKRQFIHEYCAFFGCESASYDEEPKRNVVATAFGDTSHLPGLSVLEVVQREMGQRKVPAPPSVKTNIQPQLPAPLPPPSTPNAWNKPLGQFKTLSEVVKANSQSHYPAVESKMAESPSTEANAKPKGVIDYFDFTD